MNGTADPNARVVISCRNVWKVFGAQPKSLADLLAAQMSATETQKLPKHALPSKEELLAAGSVVAVRDVSFDVVEGETFVVMGLSGSGKSTLLRCLPRLIEPTVGQVWVDGVDVTQADRRRLRELRRHRMSMVFQNFGLFPHRRVIDNVAYGLEIQGVRRAERTARAREVLELVNLSGWENHYPGQLSGGMQQRVGLARALAVDPAILLFDEPFSALDPVIRREMQDELLRLELHMAKTLVFITHDFVEAIKLGSRIAIMRDGAFVQVGTPEEIVLHPADAYVAEFTQDVPKAKVLTARTIMRPVNGTTGEQMGNLSILPSAKLDEMIPILAATDQIFPVVDEQERLLGCIDRQAIMWALSPTGGRPEWQGLPA
ncbi:MAG: betaine/proline/choline family ABC transporter ATP-binding protein [Caldilineaceae bacterium]|nr:betaine/proline/choline family ABC transporter ATP-binding protein [Caldilineaceae bacterium]